MGIIMSTEEVCKYIGLSRSKIYQLIRKKEIPAFKIGRQYKFSTEIIYEWLVKKNIMKGGGENE